MRILVTGREGQLVRSLLERASAFPDLEVIAAGRPLVDLAEPDSIGTAIRAVQPDLVINAAAYTAVDRAEAEPELAFRINAEAAGEAAAAAREVGAPVIQLSTDYVFDGRSGEPYREDAPTNPLNIYGASKLRGEEAVRSANPRHLILRTSWVYSPFGSNFVKTMLRLAEERKEVRVVADQHGSPTSALDLADALLRIAREMPSRTAGEGSTCHLAGAGSCSWAEFAAEIFKASEASGGPSAIVVPIGSSDYPTPAARPLRSVLDTSAIRTAFGIQLRPWQSSVRDVVARLLKQAA